MSDADEWWETEEAADHCGVSASRFRIIAKDANITSRREKRRVEGSGSAVKEYLASEVRALKVKRDASPGRGNWGKGREPTGGWLARTKTEGAET